METEGPFRRLLETVDFSPPKIPLVSSALGRMLTVSDCTADGWPHQLTTPAAGADEAVQLLLDQEYRLFLQVGPSSILSEVTSVRERQECLLLPTIGSELGHEDRSHWRTLLSSLSQLYLRGVAVDWAGFEHGYQRYKVPLPTSVFNHGGGSSLTV